MFDNVGFLFPVMEAIKPTPNEFEFCMKDSGCIRNVCILAHVDHGKTTLADLLLSTNRLVSKRMAGFLRYLDDRPDEQEKGITMKSSAVSLLNIIPDPSAEKKNRKILLNLVDTPGHVDFSSEVGAALRVSDGSLILVDVVEGVCVQTRESIKQAFEEHAKMILVLNKFDRFVTELHRDVNDIFESVLRVIEDCNATIAELYHYRGVTDVDVEDTGLLFSPDTGNVIFASAIDGWGFTTSQIAYMLVTNQLVQNETVESLNRKLWDFDCYVDSKQNIQTGAIDRKKMNLFKQFVLRTIVYIYETIVVRMEKNKTESILKRLGITNVTRDMTHNDPKIQVRAILQAWHPLSVTILLQCFHIIPPPNILTSDKIHYLLNYNKYCEDVDLHNCLDTMIGRLKNFNTNESFTLAYVSKMFAVSKKNLSENKVKVFVPRPKDQPPPTTIRETQLDEEQEQQPPADENVFIALARIFTGTLRVGQEIHIIHSSNLPNEPPRNVVKVAIKQLYMLFGRELMLVDAIPAGNFCGIGGLDTHIVRTATLATDANIIPFVERSALKPIVRNSIEPVNPKDLPTLRNGLKMLMQCDSCVQVLMQETGEMVLLTAGDVHLAKCIEDLKKLATIQVHVSRPMVSVRETVVNKRLEPSKFSNFSNEFLMFNVVIIHLPVNIVDFIKTNSDLLTLIEKHQHKSLVDIMSGDECEGAEKTFKNEVTRKNVALLRDQLRAEFKKGGFLWETLSDRIWSVNDNMNLLINDTETYKNSIFLRINEKDKRSVFDHCIVNAFNGLCKAGPICEEPLMNCAFIVKQFDLCQDDFTVTPQIAAALEKSLRTTMEKAFSKQDARIMEPMFSTDIQVNTNILGESHHIQTIINTLISFETVFCLLSVFTYMSIKNSYHLINK